MISQTAEYALRAVVYLAEQQEARTTSEIAEKTQSPVNYLAKVMQCLSRAGLVHSQRGLHGGFVLSSAAEELTVLEVVNAVEPIGDFTNAHLACMESIFAHCIENWTTPPSRSKQLSATPLSRT